MNVLFLTHYFPPEVGAPQARIYELARELLKRGHEVSVLTGFPNYPSGIVHEGYRGKMFLRENVDGICVIRTWVYATPNKGFAKRLINHLSFTFSSLWATGAIGPCDVIVVESPPLFLGISGYLISRLRRVPYVFNVADLWPESAVALGALKNGIAIRLAEALEAFLYARAAKITVVTRGLRATLLARGLSEDKVALMTNGVDASLFNPNVDGKEFRSIHGLDSYFVVTYAGTHGMAQGLRTVLDAAHILSEDDGITFLLVGDGAEKEDLVREVGERGLRNVLFLPPQPKKVMPQLLAASDACLVPLRKLELFKTALPSKMYEAMASARPIILAAEGEAEALLKEADGGLCVPPEDSSALAAAVRRLAADAELRHRLGANGRAYVTEHFSREKIAEKLEALLESVVQT